MPEQDSVDQACQEHDPPPLSNVAPPQVEPPALHGLVIGDFVIEGIDDDANRANSLFVLRATPSHDAELWSILEVKYLQKIRLNHGCDGAYPHR